LLLSSSAFIALQGPLNGRHLPSSRLGSGPCLIHPTIREAQELRKRDDERLCFDRADAVVRVPIDGLNEDAAQRALKRANREAMRRLEAPIRAKKLRYPITMRMLDSSGVGVTGAAEVRRQANPVTTPEFLFYLIAEDGHGHRVCARIELVRQVIQ
jgi:hypothetical protein